MNLKELYIKTFQRHKCVIIHRINESGRLTEHWAIPTPDNTVELLGMDDAVVLHRDAMLLTTKRNIPTYVVTYKSCEPVKVEDLKKDGLYTTQELKAILKNDLAQKAFNAANKSKIGDDIKLVIAVIVLGFVVLGYFINSQIQTLKPADPEPEIVEVVGNGQN